MSEEKLITGYVTRVVHETKKISVCEEDDDTLFECRNQK
jgi:hypothetical protein